MVHWYYMEKTLNLFSKREEITKILWFVSTVVIACHLCYILQMTAMHQCAWHVNYCPSTLLSIFLLKIYKMLNLEHNLDLLKVCLEGRNLLSMLKDSYTYLYHLCLGILCVLLFPLLNTMYYYFQKLPLISSMLPLVKTMTMNFSINRNERDTVSLEHQ